jgi:hypothetical protein
MHLPLACSSALTWVQSGLSSLTRPWLDEHPERTSNRTTIAVFMMADGKKRGPRERASEPDLAYDRSLLG